MNVELDIEKELQAMGLVPKDWPQVLETIKAKLPGAEWEKFTRSHKNFVAYRSEGTSSRFYGFVFTHGLQWDINAFRYARLRAILTDLLAELQPGLAILDVGAGSGIIASMIKRHCAPASLVVQDPCREIRDELQAQGFTVLPHPAPVSPPQWKDSVPAGFDLILCIDSLGEINSDEDGSLAKPDAANADDLPDQLEERYGFAQKLRSWKNYLAPGGRVLLWEPFAYQSAMESLATALQSEGWQAHLLSRAPSRNYLELRLI